MSGRDTDHENLPKRRVERVEQSWEEPHSNPSLDGAQVEPVDSDQARAPKLFSTFPVSSRALAPNDPEAASSSIQMEGTASTTMHVHASSNIEEPTMFGTLGDGGKMTADDLYEAMRSGVEIELLEEGGLNTSLPIENSSGTSDDDTFPPGDTSRNVNEGPHHYLARMRLIDLDPETVALRDILVLEDGPFKIHLRALPGVWYMPAGGTTPAGFWCRRDGCGDRVTYGIPGSFFADKGSLDVHIGGNHTVWIRMESQWPEHGPTACQKCRTVVEGAAGMREHALYGGCPMQLWWVHHAPPDVDVGPIIESLGGWTWERLQALCVPGRKIKLSFGENTSPRVQYWLDKMATEGFPERRPSPDPYEDLWWKHWTPPIRVGPPPPGFGSL